MVAFLDKVGFRKKTFQSGSVHGEVWSFQFRLRDFLSLHFLWPVFRVEKQKSKYLVEREIDIDFPTMIG